MLIDQIQLFALLRCPKTGSMFTERASSGILQDSLCDLSGENLYPKIGKKPVLVNFENSVLGRERLLGSSAQSVVSRNESNGIFARVKRVLTRTSPVCEANIRSLLDYSSSLGHRPLVLLIGGGAAGEGMQEFFDSQAIDLVSFDIYDSPNVQLIADAHELPFDENTFDLVIIQAVLEHVLEPQTVVSQIHKVLKPGGWVYAETPFMQQVHEGAYDFTRFSERGHRYLFKNFDKIASGATSGPGTSLVWSLEHFFRALFRSKLVGKMVRGAFFWLQYVDDVLDNQYALDGACAVYFMGKKSQQILQPKSLVAGYRGGQ